MGRVQKSNTRKRKDKLIYYISVMGRIHDHLGLPANPWSHLFDFPASQLLSILLGRLLGGGFNLIHYNEPIREYIAELY